MVGQNDCRSCSGCGVSTKDDPWRWRDPRGDAADPSTIARPAEKLASGSELRSWHPPSGPPWQSGTLEGRVTAGGQPDHRVSGPLEQLVALCVNRIRREVDEPPRLDPLTAPTPFSVEAWSCSMWRSDCGHKSVAPKGSESPACHPPRRWPPRNGALRKCLRRRRFLKTRARSALCQAGRGAGQRGHVGFRTVAFVVGRATFARGVADSPLWASQGQAGGVGSRHSADERLVVSW